MRLVADQTLDVPAYFPCCGILVVVALLWIGVALSDISVHLRKLAEKKTK